MPRRFWSRNCPCLPKPWVYILSIPSTRPLGPCPWPPCAPLQGTVVWEKPSLHQIDIDSAIVGIQWSLLRNLTDSYQVDNKTVHSQSASGRGRSNAQPLDMSSQAGSSREVSWRKLYSTKLTSSITGAMKSNSLGKLSLHPTDIDSATVGDIVRFIKKSHRSSIQWQLESYRGRLMDPHWGLSLRGDATNALPLLEPGTWMGLTERVNSGIEFETVFKTICNQMLASIYSYVDTFCQMLGDIACKHRAGCQRQLDVSVLYGLKHWGFCFNLAQSFALYLE